MKDTSAILAKHIDAICRELAEHIAMVAGGGIGYTLFLWPAGRALFASNAATEDNIRGVSSFLRMWQAGHPGLPLATVADANLDPEQTTTRLDLIDPATGQSAGHVDIPDGIRRAAAMVEAWMHSNMVEAYGGLRLRRES